MKQTSNSVEQILQQLDLKKDGRELIYIAVPLSSGFRLWEFACEHGLTDPTQARRRFPVQYETKVWKANVQDANLTFHHAEQLFPHHQIVNPARVNVSGWSQEQYRRARKVFISKFISSVLVSRHWPYSRGCVDEVLHALKIRIPVIDMDQHVLSYEDVYEQLANAYLKSVQMGLTVPFLAKIAEAKSHSSALEKHRSVLLCK